MAQRIALVTGATGAIGPSLVGALLPAGYDVRALVRSSSATRTLAADASVVVGDLADRFALDRAMDGADVVFHLAAKLHVSNPGSADRAEYERVNVEGTQRVVEAAQAARVKRLVFFSTINVYGPSRRGPIWEETSPLQPDSWYAESKAKAERVALDSVPSVVLRLAAVYGPGMKGNYPRMLSLLRRGLLALVGDGSNRRTLVHVDDVTSTALLAAEHLAAPGQIYNATDGEVHTLREIASAMADALGKSPPRLYLPERPVRLAVGLVEDGCALAGRKGTLGRFTVDKLVEDMAVSSVKIQRDLGFRPRYNLVSGWRQTLRSAQDE